MATVGTLDVLLRLNARSFDKGMQTSLRKAERLAQGAQRAGRRLTTGLTLPLAAIGAASIKMAVDAEESANKFNVVMGSAADDVRRRFEKLHDVMPLTLDEMEKLAAGVQDLLVPLGFVREEAAMMSADMVDLAGDLASFNNVAADVPLEALKSALAGMSRPLRQFGVDASETRLKTLALSEGLIAQGEAMTQAVRAQAVMIAVTRDSADAIGDKERTANSAANTLRRLARDMRELAQTIGDILVPVVIPLVQKLNDVLKWLRDLDPATQKWIVGIAAAAAAVGPLLLVLGTLGALLIPLAPAIIGVTTALWAKNAALVALIPGIRSFAGALAFLQLSIGPAGWLVMGLGAVAAGLTLVTKRKLEVSRATKTWNDELERMEGLASGKSAEVLRKEMELLAPAVERARQRLADLRVQESAARAMGGAEGLAEFQQITEQIESQEQLLELLDARIRGAASAYADLKDALPDLEPTSEAFKIQADQLARALDLDINRQEILDAAIERRQEINELLVAGVGSLEREVALVRELNELNAALQENVVRRIGLTDDQLGLTDELGVQTREWSRTLEKVGPLFGPALEGARDSAAAVDQANMATEQWAMSVLSIGAGFRGILGTVSRIALAFMSGGPLAGLATLGSSLPFFHTGGFMRPNSLGVVKPNEEIIQAGAVGATVMPTERTGQSSSASAGDIAAAILQAVPVPSHLPPEALAETTFYRRLLAGMVADGRSRGVLA